MSLVGNIAGKGFLPAPWLTSAHSSVTTSVTSCICGMAIFWKAPIESMAGNSRKHLRTSHPCNDPDRTALPQYPHFSRTHAMCDRKERKKQTDGSDAPEDADRTPGEPTDDGEYDIRANCTGHAGAHDLASLPLPAQQSTYLFYIMSRINFIY